MNENKTNINWDSGANRKLLVTIDKSYFQKKYILHNLVNDKEINKKERM